MSTNPRTRRIEEEVGDEGSVVIDDVENKGAVNSEGDEAHSKPSKFETFTRIGLVEVIEGTPDHVVIKNSFFACLGPNVDIVAVHKNSVTTGALAAKARWDMFQILAKALATKCGGDANIKYAWYGGSREEISRILSHGFSISGETGNGYSGSSHGVGICLFPGNFLADSVPLSVPDENGLRHLLLCRVIMGKMEAIPAGSKQFHPSSVEFDSGVDDLAMPTKFIVWSSFMNSHIFPNFVISFKAHGSNGLTRIPVRPRSPWMSFPVLLSRLTEILDPPKMALISKSHEDFRNNNITRAQLIRRTRLITGDELLMGIIKSYRDKGSATGGGSIGGNSGSGVGGSSSNHN